MPTGVARVRSISTTPIAVRKGTVLVVLSWGPVAWYLCVRPAMTVGELRDHLARKIGRLFDRAVIGLEFLVTGSEIAPDLNSPLGTLTHSGCRNVCLDVTSGPRDSATSAATSIGEHLLRKHMHNEWFQVGVDQGLWRLIELRWPYAVFGFISGDGEHRRELGLRFNLEKYPTAPPVLELWDVESRAPIAASDWPQPFIRFVAANYPHFVGLSTQPYTAELLRISAQVATRRKEVTSEGWDRNGDLTQVLARASCSFRSTQPSRSGQSAALARQHSHVFHRQRV